MFNLQQFRQYKKPLFNIKNKYIPSPKIEETPKREEKATIQKKELPIQQQNQHRLLYDETSTNVETRTFIPRELQIDLQSKLNSNQSNKTIEHILDKSNGFGDYLRGSILLAEYAKRYKIQFKMNISKHPLSNYLDKVDTNSHSVETKIELICFNGGESDDKLISLLDKFINSKEETLYITTNLYYNINLVTRDIKDYINTFFNFKEKYYTMAKELSKMDKYKIIHIRCQDDYFNKDFNSDKLLAEIIKLQFGPDTIVMSNNYSIKRKLNKIFGFHFIDTLAVHTVNVSDYKDLESTIIDYIILSKSYYTHCFSFYHHGSGFSEQCSILNDIPYKVVYLPYMSIVQPNVKPTPEASSDIQLIFNHYDNLLEGSFLKNIPISIENPDNVLDSYSNISFITLTNTGYVDYTLNCLRSLNAINMKKQLHCYCIGEEGYNTLKKKGFQCELIDDEKNSNFQTFRTDNWSNITYYKFKIIYENLLNHEFVCITDGDIVYENNLFFDFLLKNIENNDLLIQSEGIDTNDICSGFMFIKSNQLTISLFSPENVEAYKNKRYWDDQVYVNEIKHKLKYKKLPLALFPTGKYYYNYNDNIKPYLIHFNWIVGNEKKSKMISYNKWFTKVKICQHGTDGFGHQLEGMLRLLSLSINNKADYKYNYKKNFQFEHTNFDIQKLTKYLKEALKFLSNDKYDEIDESYNVILSEQRTFEEILKNDNLNNLYLYDGVCCSIPEKLPPNFEFNQEIEKSLPILREAFVEKNYYLPKPSYDNKFINVCCHIRLGDAIGQRILDNDKLYEIIKYFQKKYNKYRIIVHSDGDVSKIAGNNTILYNSKTDVLQVLSDFIFADILLINYSSLSIAAHLLGDKKQKVICPTHAGASFKQRVLDKCISCDDFLKYANNI